MCLMNALNLGTGLFLIWGGGGVKTVFGWGLGLFVASEGFLTFFRHLSLPRFVASDICHSDVCHLTVVGVSSLTSSFF